MGHSLSLFRTENMFWTIILSTIFQYVSGNVVKAPEWLPLECQAGHKYFFSEMFLSWEGAKAECTLYGGWLVAINSLQEQNCLMKAAIGIDSSNHWAWTDATDFRGNGVWVHANDESNELLWINHKWNC